jgi:REP element-mobilizing transposase RayT
MPRQARLDAPGTLHHVILRGIEKRAIFRDDADRKEFVSRLSRAATANQTRIYAWALLPNHAHFLLRSGPSGLPTFMQKVLTGYAIYFNRRHHRHGHLFQNRYKSIVCDEDTYFRELVRYIHLNPLRAQIVADLGQMDRYPWSGHAVLMGRVNHPWQDADGVLAWFGSRKQEASKAYRAYVAEGIPLGRRPELVGGGLVRSLGGWSQVRTMRAVEMRTQADERILGNGDFVERMLREAEERIKRQVPISRRLAQARQYIERECAGRGINIAELLGVSRRAPIARLRQTLACHLVSELGLSLAETARLLGVTTSGIFRTVERSGGVLFI